MVKFKKIARLLELDGYYVTIERVKNDCNGNPRYCVNRFIKNSDEDCTHGKKYNGSMYFGTAFITSYGDDIDIAEKAIKAIDAKQKSFRI